MVYNLGMNNTSINSQALAIKKRLLSNLRKNPRGWDVKQANRYMMFIMDVDANLFIRYEHITDYPEWSAIVHPIICNRMLKEQ